MEYSLIWVMQSSHHQPYVVEVYGPRQEGSIRDVKRNQQGSPTGRVRQRLWGIRATVQGLRV